MDKDEFKKVATLCVLKYKNKFLLLKRFNEPNVGKYVPVGGKLKQNETPKDGVIRETFEETGIRVHDPKFFGILTETSPTKYNWVFIFSHQRLNLLTLLFLMRVNLNGSSTMIYTIYPHLLLIITYISLFLKIRNL